MAVITCVIYFMCLWMAVNPSRWTRFCGRLLLVCFLFACIGGTEVTDFVSVNVLPDGEVETRIHYNGISAKETRASNGNEHGVKFRELTDGRRFIQLIYENETLKDCEFVRQRRQAISFLKSFKSDLRNLIPTSNITLEILDGKPLPDDINTWLSYKKLRNICRRTHKRIRNEVKLYREEESKENSARSWFPLDASFLLAPGTLWCGHMDNASRYTHLGIFSGTDRCCRKHDQCKKNINGNSRKYQFYNPTPFTISHCYCDARSKRGLNDLFRIPGTKWCGKGYSATKYTELGLFSRTDMCCRAHDKACPFWIGGLQTKYGLHNFRMNTLMHCHCDERFRACLKMVGTSDANLVGKIFFNFVQTKCFVLKKKRACKKKSWWGKKCLKKRVITKAILRDNIPY